MANEEIGRDSRNSRQWAGELRDSTHVHIAAHKAAS